MKLSGVRHEGKGVRKRAPPRPEGVANGVTCGVPPTPGVQPGVELLTDDEIRVPVELLMVVEEEVVNKVVPFALLTVAAAVVAALFGYTIETTALKYSDENST